MNKPKRSYDRETDTLTIYKSEDHFQGSVDSTDPEFDNVIPMLDDKNDEVKAVVILDKSRFSDEQIDRVEKKYFGEKDEKR